MPSVTDVLQMAIHHLGKGEYDQARSICQRVLEVYPDQADAWHILGTIASTEGNFLEAQTLVKNAIHFHPNEPSFYQKLATIQTSLLLYHDAIETLTALQDIDPSLSNISADIDYLKALIDYNKTAAGDFGIELEQLEKIFKYRLKQNPTDVNNLAYLAGVFEARGELEKSWEYCNLGQSIDPHNVEISIVSAKILRRQKEPALAISLLNSCLDKSLTDKQSCDIYEQLGKCYDLTDNFGQAFKCFEKLNLLLKNQLPAIAKNQQAYIDLVDKIKLTLTHEWFESWKENYSTECSSGPIFLLGFPRSGTTLLGQILEAHPKILILEETSCLTSIVDKLIAAPEGYPTSLVALSKNTTRELQDAYMESTRVWQKLHPEKEVIIDKMPLSTIDIAAIYRLFPKAKIIFAIRHPLDVCLSCLTTRFSLNGSMANFLDLNDTAHLYQQTMDIWQSAVDNLPIDYLPVHYEKLVNNLPDESARIFSFLNLGDDHIEIDPIKLAELSKPMRTASYDQVSQPIYLRSAYRWKNYEEQLSPIKNILAPYIKKFGYELKS